MYSLRVLDLPSLADQHKPLLVHDFAQAGIWPKTLKTRLHSDSNQSEFFSFAHPRDMCKVLTHPAGH